MQFGDSVPLLPRIIYVMKKLNLSECNWHRIAVSLWSSFAFIGWGASLIVIGPTLLDLADHVSVDISIVSLMFSCRAIGALIGVLAIGVILDKLSGYLYTTIFIVLVLFGATTAVIPLSIHIAMLSVFMILSGTMSGCTVTSLQFAVLKLWQDKSGPVNQLLHFCYALGAFISPLIAKPFIDNDRTTLVHTTCRVSNQSAFIFDPDLAENDSNCSTIYSIDDGTQNCSNQETSNSSSNFAFAYWCTVSILVPATIAFLYFAIKYELCKWCSYSNVNTTNPEETKSDDENDSKEKEKPSTEKSLVQQPLCYKITILALLSGFVLVYVGAEATFGTLIFTVAVTGELCFSKSSAALLQSVFWGSFAFMRFFSVSLALLKVRPSIMLTGNLSCSLLASITMVIFPHNTIAVWIASAVLGMSFASVFPTTMTWKSENIQTSGTSTAIVVCGLSIGVMALPTVVGVMIERLTPDSLFYITFGCIVIASCLATAVFAIAFVYDRRKPTDSTIHKKKKYQSIPNHDSD